VAQVRADEQPGNGPRRSLLRQERSRETRRRLIRAATKLWSRHGYDDTTIEQLCAAAGVSRPTFYLYFETKDRLLEELAWATAESLAGEFHTLKTGSIDDQLAAFVEGLDRRMQSVPKPLAALVLARVAGWRSPDSDPTDRVIFDDLLREIVEHALAQGEVDPSLDATVVGEILGSLTMDALQRWVRTSASDDGPALKHALQLRFALVLDGIR
jgi:AcrR family transcriptional regulator